MQQKNYSPKQQNRIERLIYGLDYLENIRAENERFDKWLTAKGVNYENR